MFLRARHCSQKCYRSCVPVEPSFLKRWITFPGCVSRRIPRGTRYSKPFMPFFRRTAAIRLSVGACRNCCERREFRTSRSRCPSTWLGRVNIRACLLFPCSTPSRTLSCPWDCSGMKRRRRIARRLLLTSPIPQRRSLTSCGCRPGGGNRNESCAKNKRTTPEHSHAAQDIHPGLGGGWNAERWRRCHCAGYCQDWPDPANDGSADHDWKADRRRRAAVPAAALHDGRLQEDRGR